MLWRVCGGSLHARTASRARVRASAGRIRVHLCPWPCTAPTDRRSSTTSSARTMSPARCGGPWRTTGCTTPTCSPAPAAAARRPRARILARSLNCEQGPTPDPCGVCQSCTDLAANGPGSLDVIELDAASHGGVEDTRDLRERAMFAPASSRYKVYIIDEAHMVTTAGFNALLKLVEEPPEHVRFVFATTEAEKVLPTIRSRTHNYTFRLVPVQDAAAAPRARVRGGGRRRRARRAGARRAGGCGQRPRLAVGARAGDLRGRVRTASRTPRRSRSSG